MPAVINILLALRQRDLTGEGQHLDIAMTEGLFTFAWYALAQGHAAGKMPGARDNPLTGSSPRYALYPTADDRFVAMGGLEDKFWALFCQAIGLPAHWRDDQEDAEGTRAAVSALISTEPAAVWRARLEPLDCCACIVATLEEALADPQFAGRGVFAHRVSEEGGLSMPACVVPLAATFRASPDILAGVGEAGCDTAAVLSEGGGAVVQRSSALKVRPVPNDPPRAERAIGPMEF